MHESVKNQTVEILKSDPTVALIAKPEIDPSGVLEMVDWVASRRPECLPSDFLSYENATNRVATLFPHGMQEDHRQLTDAELLVELAGRKCYDSFGKKAGRKTNRDYIANTQAGEIPHASIVYHVHLTFFIAGVSRRVSHELIRHYVGASRDEEGSPSQESTRYVEHSGRYVAHPKILNDAAELQEFEEAMRINRSYYVGYIGRRMQKHEAEHGHIPKGMDRKRIYESASAYLSHSAETSFLWTTNPIALAKLLRERDNPGADLEFQRLARKWKSVALNAFPNLFPQPWMQT